MKYTEQEIGQIRAQLGALETSPVFAQAERILNFLRFTVEEVLADRGDQLNQYRLGIDVYGRDERFDPAVDSIVRVDAGRLRAKLREYYDTEGKNTPLRFDLPKGTYAINILLPPTFKKTETTHPITNGGQNPGRPEKYSLVVLPFESISHDPNDSEIADGITTEIIDNLGRAAMFEVASRHSAFAYKGRDVTPGDLARELGVNYILEGSLRRVGNHLRIAVALTDAQSERQLWTESYDRELVDLFDLEDDISHAVVDSLGKVLWSAAMKSAQSEASENLDPLGLVHRSTGMFFNYTRSKMEDSERLARHALEHTPNQCYGYTILGFILAHKILNHWTDKPEERCKEVVETVDRALELKPEDSWVLSFAGEALMWVGEHQRAVSLLERALTQELDNPLIRAFLGHALLHTGPVEKGADYINNAIELSQGDRVARPWRYAFGCQAATQLEDYQKAVATGEKSTEIMNGCPPVLMHYCNALAVVGQLDAAHAALDELRRLSPQITLDHIEWAYRLSHETEEIADRYLRGLRKLNW